jgi:hypothetical protein
MIGIIENPVIGQGNTTSRFERQLVQGVCIQNLDCDCHYNRRSDINRSTYCNNCMFPIRTITIRCGNIVYNITFIMDFGYAAIPNITIICTPIGVAV